jgi:hypothetical protein
MALRFNKVTALALLARAIFCARASLGDVVSLPPSMDTTLFSPSANLSDGSGPFIRVGRVGTLPGAGGTQRRGLIQFDIDGSVPHGSTITAVALQMFQSDMGSSPSAVTLTLKRVTSSWGEGASVANMGTGAVRSGGLGGAARTDDATWTQRFFGASPALPWAAAGGDFVSTISSQVAARTSNGSFTWPSTAQFVSDAQFFLDNPLSNFGWMIQGNETAFASARLLNSSESVTNRPSLTITFTPPPARLTGDVDNDKDVDRVDLSLLTQKYSATNITGGPDVGDFTGDMKVTLADLLLVKQNYGATAPSPAAVPEPGAIVTGLMLLALAAGAQIRRVRGA